MGADLAAGFDTRAVGEPHVHDNDVRLEFRGRGDGIRDRARVGHHVEAGTPIEKRHQSLPNDLMVVDDQEPERGRSSVVGHRCDSFTDDWGIETMIRVPESALLATVSVPPSLSTRACMLPRP